MEPLLCLVDTDLLLLQQSRCGFGSSTLQTKHMRSVKIFTCKHMCLQNLIIYFPKKRHVVHCVSYCKPHPDLLLSLMPSVFVLSSVVQSSLTFSCSDAIGLDYPEWLLCDGSTQRFPLGSCLSLEGSSLTRFDSHMGLLRRLKQAVWTGLSGSLSSVRY